MPLRSAPPPEPLPEPRARVAGARATRRRAASARERRIQPAPPPPPPEIEPPGFVDDIVPANPGEPAVTDPAEPLPPAEQAPLMHEAPPWPPVVMYAFPSTAMVPIVTADAHVDMETTLDAPTTWSGRPISLAVPLFFGDIALDANGERLASHETTLSHTWRIESALDSTRALVLRMQLDTRANRALSVVPRLSPPTDGDEASVAVATTNLFSAVAGTAMTTFVTVLYAVLFFLDRKRAAHGWFALQAAVGSLSAAYPLWLACARPWTFVIVGLLAVVALSASLGFLRSYFPSIRLPAGLRACLVALTLVVLLEVPSGTRRIAAPVSGVLVTVAIAAIVRALVQQLRTGGDRFAPGAFATAWLVLVLAFTPDFQADFGSGAALAGGLIGIPTGLGLFAMLQAVVLGRDHIRSLHSAPTVAKISDFGISRFGALDDSVDVDVEAATLGAVARERSPRDLTETGMLMGTPVYMPPEAWHGPARQPSADVFSLGVLAYEALTGRSPFAIPPFLLVRSRQPIPAPAPLEGIDGKVAALVLACMQVEPSGRPRAKDIVLALTDALLGR